MTYVRLGLGALILAALGASSTADAHAQGEHIDKLQSGLDTLTGNFATLQARVAADEGASAELKESVAAMADDLQGIATALPRGAAVVAPVEEDHPDLQPQTPAETGDTPAQTGGDTTQAGGGADQGQ